MNKRKETQDQRKERLALSKCMVTRVKSDKTKYSRKVKHSGNYND